MAQTKVLVRARDDSRTNRPRQPRRRLLLLISTVIISVAIAAVSWQAGLHHRSTGNATNTSSGPTVGGFTHVPESAFASQPPFTGAAVTKYGQAAVQAAYRQAVNFAFDTGWNLTLMAKRHSSLTSLDFAPIRASLTASFAAAFEVRVRKALAKDKTAIRELEGATFFAIAGPGGAKPIDGAAAVTNRSFTRAKFAVDKSNGRQRLLISFTVKALIHLQDKAGKRYVVQTGRAVRYLLVPNVGTDARVHPFLIDAWAYHLQSKKPQSG